MQRKWLIEKKGEIFALKHITYGVQSFFCVTGNIGFDKALLLKSGGNTKFIWNKYQI